LSIFFAVIIGIFTLISLTPNLTALSEGKAAAAAAFEILDRKTAIDPNAAHSIKKTLEGNISFKNINFYYPSRPEHKILDNFSCDIGIG